MFFGEPKSVFAEAGIFVAESGFEEFGSEGVEAIERAEGLEAGKGVGGLMGEIF